MKYKIAKIERKTTSTGKEFSSVNLQDEAGAIFERVSVWSDSPVYSSVTDGGTLEGEISTNDKGYMSFKAPFKGNAGGFKGGMGKELMQEKATNIEHAQDRKADSIMTASTFSSATNIVVELMKKDDAIRQNWQAEWEHVRHWLVRQWGNTEQKKVADTDVDYPTNKFPNNSPF